jgi:predicted transport protein
MITLRRPEIRRDVSIIGHPGTPDIEVAVEDIDQAIEIARDLANVLHLAAPPDAVRR